jgi:hypothetical protein
MQFTFKIQKYTVGTGYRAIVKLLAYISMSVLVQDITGFTSAEFHVVRVKSYFTTGGLPPISSF